MPRLDTDTLEMLLTTVRDYAERELTPEFLLELDHEDAFPAKVLKDLYDPSQIGLHLLFIPEEAGGSAAERTTFTGSARSWPASTSESRLASWPRASEPTRSSWARRRNRSWLG